MMMNIAFESWPFVDIDVQIHHIYFQAFGRSESCVCGSYGRSERSSGLPGVLLSSLSASIGSFVARTEY